MCVLDVVHLLMASFFKEDSCPFYVVRQGVVSRKRSRARVYV